MPAVIYQSSQTNTAGTTSVAVTKPTSLAVGDLMIAQIYCFDGGNGSPVITAPSGWTEIQSELIASNTSRVASYSKIADSSDVAASNFTWSCAIAERMIGAISRFTNPNSTPLDQILDGSNSGTAYPSLAGITPTKAAGTMLILTYNLAGSTATTSGYAVTTNNPTWTEAYDVASGASTDFVSIAMAYAHRPELTATGSVTVTASGNITAGVVAILNLPAQDLTFATATTGALAPTIRTVIDQIATVTSSLLAPTVTEIENIWSNVSKNVSSWVNQSKT